MKGLTENEKFNASSECVRATVKTKANVALLLMQLSSDLISACNLDTKDIEYFLKAALSLEASYLNKSNILFANKRFVALFSALESKVNKSSFELYGLLENEKKLVWTIVQKLSPLKSIFNQPALLLGNNAPIYFDNTWLYLSQAFQIVNIPPGQKRPKAYWTPRFSTYWDNKGRLIGSLRIFLAQLAPAGQAMPNNDQESSIFPYQPALTPGNDAHIYLNNTPFDVWQAVQIVEVPSTEELPNAPWTLRFAHDQCNKMHLDRFLTRLMVQN